MREVFQCCLVVSRNQVVPNKRTNIVQVGPGDGHVDTSMSDVDESIVLCKIRFGSTSGPHDTYIVLIVVHVRGKIYVVNPDSGGCLLKVLYR